MPWVDRVIIVLSVGSSQIPKWLNTHNMRVKVVYDYQFIPKDVLPTFNSNVVELFFPRIEGLSEHYLTACDDYLLMRPFEKEEFFTKEGKIRLKLEDASFNRNIYSSTIANSVRIIYPKGVIEENDRIKCLWANHTVTPHIKSINNAFLSEHEEEIYNSLTRERDRRNLTWLIYPLNALRKGLLKDSDIKVICKKLTALDDIININFEDSDIAVLNDWFDDWGFSQAKKILCDKMEFMFPDKSKFETGIQSYKLQNK